MNPDPANSKLRQEQREKSETEEVQQQTTEEKGKSFDSVEEMIAYDRSGIVPPDTVSERLNESISKVERPVEPWWRRWFKRG